VGVGGCLCRWKGSRASWLEAGHLRAGCLVVVEREVGRWWRVGRSVGRCRLLLGLQHRWAWARRPWVVGEGLWNG
jgi:hypothetical protein